MRSDIFVLSFLLVNYEIYIYIYIYILVRLWELLELVVVSIQSELVSLYARYFNGVVKNDFESCGFYAIMPNGCSLAMHILLIQPDTAFRFLFLFVRI